MLHSQVAPHTHALVDRESSGPTIAFAVGTYVAILVARIPSARAGVTVAAYDALIRRARLSAVPADASAVFLAADGRRVTALVALRGHDAYRHLRARWGEDYSRESRGRHADSSTLTLYRTALNLGDPSIDPGSSDTYTVEIVPLGAERLVKLIAPLADAAGFRGTIVFASDDGSHSVALYRFEGRPDLATFRATSPAIGVLGAEPLGDDRCCGARPVKTYG